MAIQQIIYQFEESQRLDKFLAKELTEYTRSQIQTWINNGNILVNNQVGKQSLALKFNDVIDITIPEVVESELKKQNIPLDIVCEDQDLIVVNKQSGMVVHPGSGNKENTLVNALLFHCDDLSGISGVMRPGIVHRIDKNTSGLIVACKNDLTHKHLAKQFSNRTVVREYTAIVHGVIPHNHGRINAPIGRNPKNRQQMAVVENGKEAITNFTVIERFKDYTLISAKLETGRTHQIRVHMAYIGFPVVGDLVYGPRKVMGRRGQFLHANKLGFIHPRLNKYVEFKSPLPDYFEKFIEKIKE